MINKLSDAPDEECRKCIESYIENLYERKVLTRPADVYNYLGLRFDINYLNALETRIIFYPVEIMAEYVDRITKNYMDVPMHSRTRKSFESQVMEDISFFSTQEIVETINATGIGNYAYVYIHTQNYELKAKLEQILNEIYRYSFHKYKDELDKAVEDEIEFIVGSIDMNKEEKEFLRIRLKGDYEEQKKKILAQE